MLEKSSFGIGSRSMMCQNTESFVSVAEHLVAIRQIYGGSWRICRTNPAAPKLSWVTVAAGFVLHQRSILTQTIQSAANNLNFIPVCSYDCLHLCLFHDRNPHSTIPIAFFIYNKNGFRRRARETGHLSAFEA